MLNDEVELNLDLVYDIMDWYKKATILCNEAGIPPDQINMAMLFW